MALKKTLLSYRMCKSPSCQERSSCCPYKDLEVLRSTFQSNLQNLHRGRGVFCQSIMKSQVASPTYTPVFAALVAVIGTRLPDIPTLLVNRLVAQFKRAFKRNDRALTSSVVTFVCHLANQSVRHLYSPSSEEAAEHKCLERLSLQVHTKKLRLSLATKKQTRLCAVVLMSSS